MIYFDNSATTFKKPKQVIEQVSLGLTKYSANPGRSGHNASLQASEKVETVRNNICKFFNAPISVFTQNCTDALNLAILGSFVEGGHVICSINDHNSLIRPLFELQKQKGLEISIAKPNSKGCVELSDILPLVKPNTYMIAINHISNVDGEIANIQEIGEFCAQNCISFLVDGAQSAGHIKIDMQKSYIDYLTIAPHKGLYSPQGVGVLCISKKAKLQPIRYGGTGTDSLNIFQPKEIPECFESGTIATPNILGLGAGLKFVESNFDNINKKIDDFSTYLNFELGNIKNIKTYTHPNNSFGIIGFNIGDTDSMQVSQILNDKYHICTRGGLHCAGLKHNFLGTTKQGIVRASLCCYNTFSECEKFIKAVKEISKLL
ncbi:MAG: aminotransferase class V-fold PLP-dependent enzyme [Clostridia bacterium]|nr:aminotransferase class V-fold PLP-dependent enzyme [Clostridia bacterium]